MPPLFRLEELLPDQLLACIKQKPGILFPVGSIEWHGPQNCIAVDTLKIKAICEDIGRQTGVIVAPSLFYGVCKTLKERTGTLAGIPESTFKEYVKQIFIGFRHLGFRFIFCLSGHYEGEQIKMLREIASDMKKELPDMTVYIFIEPDFSRHYPIVANPKEMVMSAQYYSGDHAGVYETSLMMHYYPQLVDSKKLEKKLHIVNNYYVDPINSTPEFGAHLAKIIVDEASEFITDELKSDKK